MGMNLFRPFHTGEPQHDARGRLTGISRYQDVLGHCWKRFFVTGLVTMLGFAPLVLGIVYAVLSQSILVLLPAALLGGAIAGPFLACLYDSVLRALRDAPGGWWANYRKAFAQNWRGALLPGMCTGLFLGAASFAGMMLFAWAQVLPSGDTVLIYLVSWLLFILISTLYWPQLVLFEQRNLVRLRNALLFTLQNFWRVLGVAVLQLLWWMLFVLFAPLSLLLLPLVGVWFVLFVTMFLLYNQLDEALAIEQHFAQPDTDVHTD